MPRKPYRSPRDWLVPAHSRQFGHGSAERLDWQNAETPLDEALLSAARKQNDLAAAIRFKFNYSKATTAAAAFADLHPDTVRDILNGSKHATLAVLYALAAGVGLNPNVTLKRDVDAGEQAGSSRSANPTAGTEGVG